MSSPQTIVSRSESWSSTASSDLPSPLLTDETAPSPECSVLADVYPIDAFSSSPSPAPVRLCEGSSLAITIGQAALTRPQAFLDATSQIINKLRWARVYLSHSYSSLQDQAFSSLCSLPTPPCLLEPADASTTPRSLRKPQTGRDQTVKDMFMLYSQRMYETLSQDGMGHEEWYDVANLWLRAYDPAKEILDNFRVSVSSFRETRNHLAHLKVWTTYEAENHWKELNKCFPSAQTALMCLEALLQRIEQGFESRFVASIWEEEAQDQMKEKLWDFDPNEHQEIWVSEPQSLSSEGIAEEGWVRYPSSGVDEAEVGPEDEFEEIDFDDEQDELHVDSPDSDPSSDIEAARFESIASVSDTSSDLDAALNGTSSSILGLSSGIKPRKIVSWAEQLETSHSSELDAVDSEPSDDASSDVEECKSEFSIEGTEPSSDTESPSAPSKHVWKDLSCVRSRASYSKPHQLNRYSAYLYRCAAQTLPAHQLQLYQYR